MYVEPKRLLILRGNFNTKLIQFFLVKFTHTKIYNWLRLYFSSLASLSSGCPSGWLYCSGHRHNPVGYQ